jgi:pimeloyl-ACP methyl ester carboxylesterase
MLWLALACGGAPAPAETPVVPPAPAAPATPAGPEVVHLVTSDQVTLEADWYDAPGNRGVVLLHMIPPQNDRTTWPRSFIDGLVSDGAGVLVLDRRGAGKSGGVAKDAYEGPSGALDMDAAARFLVEKGHGALAIIGASNGSTTALDYTIAAMGKGLPIPTDIVFLSAGPYTENNNPVGEIPLIHTLFVYPEPEAEWNEAQKGRSPAWTLRRYTGDEHGTQLFGKHADVEQEIREFLRD